MKMRVNTRDSEFRATIEVDGDPTRIITVRCHNAPTVAREIAQRVNTHEAMVGVLQVFSSSGGMGDLLIDAIEAMNPDHPQAAMVNARMRTLVATIDGLLKTLERAETTGEVPS
jgi:hypothetical protein